MKRLENYLLTFLFAFTLMLVASFAGIAVIGLYLNSPKLDYGACLFIALMSALVYSTAEHWRDVNPKLRRDVKKQRVSEDGESCKDQTSTLGNS